MNRINPRRPGRRTTRAKAAIAAPVAIVSLFGATPALAADAPFEAAPDIALGERSGPQSVAVGDFNSDGRGDLAAADFGRNRVVVRLGNGDGTYRDAADIIAIDRPEDVVVGDFDADGTEDLAVAGYAAPYTVTVLRGLGDGRFAFHGGFNASNGSRVQSLAVGDFNGDAVADLASTSTYSVSVRLGAGNGTFSGGEDVQLSNPYPAFAVAGDFDGDGNEDVAVTLNNGPSKVGVLAGKGDGKFAPVKLAGLPNLALGLAMGDFDEDGKQDVVAPIFTESRVSVRLGNGDGTLSDDRPDVPVSGKPYRLAVADFDGDGHEDFATGSLDGGVSVRLGAGDGTFRDGGELATGEDPLSVAAGDLDGDGAQDLAIANYTAGSLSVRLGTSPAPLAGNLVVNGGFEEGLGARLPSQSPGVPGWATTGGMTFARYGAHPHRGFPSWIDAARWSGGRNLLWGGAGETTTATQDVDVAGAAAAIDGGRATARLSAELGGGRAVPDQMAATAEFLNAAGEDLGAVTAGPVTREQRRNATTLIRREGSAPVPAGTRRIRVELSSAASAPVSSALADNVKLTLDQRPAEPGGQDGDGGDGGADRTAPALGRVTLAPARFAVARGATAVAAARRGTTVRYSLSEAAAVTLRVERVVKGKRRTAGTLRRSGAAGANRVRFSGRIGRRALRPGRYRLTVRATDAAGNRSPARTRAFRVVR